MRSLLIIATALSWSSPYLKAETAPEFIAASQQILYRGESSAPFSQELISDEDQRGEILNAVEKRLGRDGVRVEWKIILSKEQLGKEYTPTLKFKALADGASRVIFRLVDSQGKTLEKKIVDNFKSSTPTTLALSKRKISDTQLSLFLNSSSASMDLEIDQVGLSTEDVTELPDPGETPTPGSWWKPSIGSSWDVQYVSEDKFVFHSGVTVYDIDLFDMDQAFFDQLKSKGYKIICYFSAGTVEDWRDDAKKFPAEVIGDPMDNWAGERWLDVRKVDQLMAIMGARLDLAVKKGCDAVDPDNMDAYDNSDETGVKISKQDQITYNRRIFEEAHARGLGVGLKNALGIIPDLIDYVDFTVNESCYRYDECDVLKAFIKQGKPVFGIEYSTSTSNFCPKANAANFDFLKKGPGSKLGTSRTACR